MRYFLLVFTTSVLLACLVPTDTTADPDTQSADARSVAGSKPAQRLPVVWNGKFSAVNRDELELHLDDLWDKTPDLSGGYKIRSDDQWGKQKPIVTCGDWIGSGGHKQTGHYWACREALYYYAFGPRALFRRSMTSVSSQFTEYSMNDLSIADIPQCLWLRGPVSSWSLDGAIATDVYDIVELCNRSTTGLCMKMSDNEYPDSACYLTLSYVGRADFNFDGAEDLLWSWRYKLGGTGFSFGHVIVSKPTSDANLSFSVLHGGGH